MRRTLSLILILAGASLAAACATQERHHFRRGAGLPPGAGMARGGLFVSPAGEPFRRSEGGPQPMRAWFGQADADHDGALTWAEFEADFMRYFATLDADHDGEIGPDEVAHYEGAILPEMASRGGGMGSGMPGGGMRGRGMGRGRGGGMRGMGGMGGMGGGRGGGSRSQGAGMGAMMMMSGAARFGLLPINHPIMDADTNFNRGVSREEFAQAAARRFALLNTDNSGRLTLEELARVRMQAFGGRQRRERGPAGDGGGPAGEASPAPQPDGD
jgi:EF hand